MTHLGGPTRPFLATLLLLLALQQISSEALLAHFEKNNSNKFWGKMLRQDIAGR